MPYVPPEDQLQLSWDRETNASTIIQVEHRQVHKGLLFSTATKFDSVATGASVYVVMVTPQDIEVHFKQASISSDGEKFLTEIIEGPAVSGGTAATAYNRNRGSTNTAQMTIKTAPSSVTGGTTIDIDLLGGGSSPGPKAIAIGTEVAGVTEWLLKENTTYVIKITNNGSSAATCVVKLIWYEVPEET